MAKFSESLKSGKFVVTAELNPPKGTDLGPAVRRRAAPLGGMVDAFNLTDSAGANMTMAPHRSGPSHAGRVESNPSCRSPDATATVSRSKANCSPPPRSA